jgi:F-type H+-transporting ATPase subunit b
MEQIIEAFGIDHRLIIIQIVNFAILAGALGYFLYTPILKLLRDREEKIAQGLKDAEAAAAAKTAADAEKQTVLAAAHKEAEAVNERAKVAADAKATEIVATAQDKAAELLKSAEAKGEAAKQAALKESENEIAKLAVLATEKMLREQA